MTQCAAPAHCATVAVRRAAMLPLLGLLAAAAGCEFPTESPLFETRFVVPLEETRITAGELLPAGVAISGAAFQITVGAASQQRTLGQLCGPPCVQLNGATVPKPAFTSVLTLPLALPADVSGGTITGGAAQVSVTHGFDFDPLRPPAYTQSGTILLAVQSPGVTLGTSTISQPFPPNTSIARSIALSGPVSGGVELVVTLVSPAGGAVRLNTSTSMRVTMAPLVVSASEARVSVQNRGISMQPVTLDLSGVDQGIRDRVRRGALVLDIANPFPVSGSLQLRLHAPGSGTDIQRILQVAPDQTTQRIELSQEDLQGLLGHHVTVTAAGPVSAEGGPLTVRPHEQVVLTPRLDLVLEIGA